MYVCVYAESGSKRVSAYVCLHVFVYTSACMCMIVCVCVCLYACLSLCVCLCVFICMCVCVCVMYVCTFAHRSCILNVPVCTCTADGE